MKILSSYPLSDDLNRRIIDAVAELTDGRGEFTPSTEGESREEIIDRIDREIADATIYLGGRLTQEQLDRAEHLQWIHVPWAGVNALLDLDLSRRPELPVSNSRGIMADAVADQVLAYLLMLNRSLPKQILRQQKREWIRYQTVEHPDRKVLRGMTLGILGYGAIGHQIALRAISFGMHVIGLRNRPEKGGPPGGEVVGPDHRDEVFRRSDFLVITLPLTDETRESIGRREFGLMKPTAYIVNVARGGIVRTPELEAALRAGKIAGGALDVTEPEPLPSDSLLWEMPNLILTPHSSGGFRGFAGAVADLFIENLQRYLAGDGLLNLVDPDRGY